MTKYLRIFVQLAALLAFFPAQANAYEDFFRAVNLDDARTVARLLERGFDPNSPDERGQPALVLASREEGGKVAALLLAHPEIKVDQPNPAGETALMMAALRGDAPLVQRLLERGAQINRAGWTPLHYAASGPQPRLVALLLDRGAELDAISPNRTTALMLAARYGAEDSARLLAERGASLVARNAGGLTASEMALGAGRDALAQRLQPR